MPGRGEFCTTLPPPWGPRDGTPLETYEYLLLPAPLRPLRLHLGPRSVCDPCKNRLRSTPSIRSTTTPPISVSTAASSSVQKPPNGGYSRLLREALQWKMSKSFQLSQVSTSCLFPRHLRCLDHIASADVFSQSQIIGPSLFLCAFLSHILLFSCHPSTMKTVIPMATNQDRLTFHLSGQRQSHLLFPVA